LPAAGEAARFPPGTTLGERYRIVGLLGRGGMGEVYRADDLKLGSSVALKFLPERLESDPGRRARFLNEVRVAQQVSHPNVCRVHDAGEANGRHFVSMEYVDGEDLASLLRRIGRLPEDKAVEIARQLCAGLAAAHEQGILHRDLKPANVMLDGRGRAKITDFGLAELEHAVEGAQVAWGTPAYQAPEQAAGRAVTIKSDLYSLGLVLYEIFTGKRALEGNTPEELTARRSDSASVTSPSSHVSSIDPAVERVILRCLEPDPADRPASALAVAAALPGADPLAAALAAGETPSPQMVAEAGGEENALRPAVALAWFGVFVAGLLITAFLSGRYGLLATAPDAKPPAALADRARTIAESLGYTEPPVDADYWFDEFGELLRYIGEEDPSPSRWRDAAKRRPSLWHFHYREGPRWQVPFRERFVQWRDPPRLYSGSISVLLETDGHMTSFAAEPPQRRAAGPVDESPFDWTPAFEAAGLDPEDLTEVDPEWFPETYCERRYAWTGTYPDQPEPEIRVEACTAGGRPVSFEVLFPFSRPWRDEPPRMGRGMAVQIPAFITLFFGGLLGAVLLARRNLRMGRGDRKGASRVAGAVVIVIMIVWALSADHAPTWEEFPKFMETAGFALFIAAAFWSMYVAVEPAVRRRWPTTLVSWARLFGGRLRDPLVGSHLLVGAALGAAISVLREVAMLAPGWLGWPPAAPHHGQWLVLRGTVDAVTELLWGSWINLAFGMVLLFVLVLLRMILRIEWLASAVFLLLFAGIMSAGWEYPLAGFLVWLLTMVAVLFTFVRYGLLAAVVLLFFGQASFHHPMTLDPSVWWLEHSLITMLGMTVLAAYGFWISLGGRSLLPGGDEGERA
jgi:serine/threonine-protein kinase